MCFYVRQDSERNVVVLKPAIATLLRSRRRACRSTLARRCAASGTAGAARCAVAAGAAVLVAASTAAALAIEHLHVVDLDLGGVAVVAFLVLPLARAQRAFDVD